jgi:hypothetical protein
MPTANYEVAPIGGHPFQTTDNSEHDFEIDFCNAEAILGATVRIVAISHDDIHAMWKFEAAVSREGTGAPQFVDALLQALSARKDLGAVLWNATLVLASDGSIKARVKGGANKTVEWLANGDHSMIYLT